MKPRASIAELAERGAAATAAKPLVPPLPPLEARPSVPRGPFCPNCTGLARVVKSHRKGGVWVYDERECDHCGLTYIRDSATWAPTGECLSWPQFSNGGK